ncbi:MAG: amidophosphoribosyltransferase, partial [Planctomycetota bacterium]
TAEEIGADLLIFQNLEDLVKCIQEGNPLIDGFECSVFNGEYVTEDVDDAYLERLAVQRSDEAKAARASSGS